MNLDRRRFLYTSLMAGAGATALPACSASANADLVNDKYAKLDEVIGAPGFKRELFKEPVISNRLRFSEVVGSSFAEFVPRTEPKELLNRTI